MTAAGVRDDHFLLLRCHNDNREALRTKFSRSTLSVKCKQFFSFIDPTTRTPKVCTLSKANGFSFFCLCSLRNYWTLPLLPFPPKRQPNKFAKCFFPRFLNLRWRQWSAARSLREFLTPYPSPWPFFLFASLCTVPTILTPGNTLRLLCALRRKNLLVNVFRNFI